MASVAGRGAQVRLDGDEQRAARGALAGSIVANTAAKRAAELAGVVSDGSTADGSTVTGTAAEDEVLAPNGIGADAIAGAVAGATAGAISGAEAGAAAVGPSTPIYLRTRDTLSLREFSPVANNDDADNGAKIVDWLQSAAYDRVIAAGLPGTFTAGTISANIDRDLYVEGAPGFTLKGAEGFPGSVLTLDGGTAKPSFFWNGGTVDTSLRGFVATDPTGTGITIKRLGQYGISRVRFKAGASYKDAVGDSGMSINQCDFGLVDHCHFIGQPDKGLYITGGASEAASDDGQGHEVRGCYFYRCNTAASATRQTRRFRAHHNIVEECNLGFGRTDAGVTSPGREMIVDHNYFYKIGGRAIRLYGTGYDGDLGGGDVIDGNVFIDWGYEFDGVTASDSRRLMDIRGARAPRITNNIMRMRDWTPVSGITAIYLGAYTLDGAGQTGITSITKGAFIHGNHFEGCYTAIQEAGGTTGNTGHNTVENVTTRLILGSGSGSKFGWTNLAGNVQPYWSAATLGKTDPNTNTGVGIGLNQDGTGRFTADATVPLRANRLTSFGPVAQFYQDDTSVGSIQTLTDIPAVSYYGTLNPPSFTTAELASIPVAISRVLRCSDGANGKACLAIGASGVGWSRVDTGGPLTTTAGWIETVAWYGTQALDFGTITAGARVTITVTATGVLPTDFGTVNPPSSVYAPNGLDFKVRCTTDQIIVAAFNETASSIVMGASGALWVIKATRVAVR